MKRNMIISIIAIGILLSIFTLQIEGGNTRISQEKTKEPVIITLVPHEQIEISHDGNFSDYGCPGLGTSEEPYIIENYNITTTDYVGVWITGTTKFFVIRNCYVDSDYSSIVINNVAEGTTAIISNVCNSNGCAIDLYSSPGATVTNNICNDNYKGIIISHSPESIVADNICNNNTYSGIYQFSSSGIYLEGSTGLTVTNNVCNNNDYGIELDSSSNITLTQNTCSNNSVGIYFIDSDSSLLTYNLIQENVEYGISLDSDSDNNIIHHNTFKDNRPIDKTSQAEDEGTNNIWYDSESEEGNYWSEWDSKQPYPINGRAQASDPYPLNERLERIKFEFVMFVPSIILLVVLHKRFRNKKVKN